MTASLGDRRRSKRKANWLGRYLIVEEKHAKEIRAALVATAEDTFRIFEQLPDSGTMGQQARKAQYRVAMKQVRESLHKTFGVQGQIIRDGRKAAAMAAAEANIQEDLPFLTRLAPSKSARDAWIAQRKTMAARNIEAVAARVLVSQRTLSKNVWSAEAISKGYVNKIVNVGLARGDSAQDIAKRVRGLIHPDVPGGVSYASMRLARTEINNAFHAQTIMDLQESPWVEYAEWHFSKTHEPQGCMCEIYEQMQYFPKDQIPSKPHPQCRCYVTGAKITDEEFEDRRKAGQYALLEDEIQAMEPAPKEGPTTKAAQPEGWTGPLVSKDAQNKAVAGQTNYRWIYEVDADSARLQAARQGSRAVQVKGYRGGLPTSGKQALLTQEYTDDKLAEHIGKELTARLAYSKPSSNPVYRVMYLTEDQVKALGNKPGVSIPLSTFESDINKLDITPAGKVSRPVVFKVEPGAKTALVGDSRVSMGTFEVQSVTDGDTPIVSLKQVDIREHDANPIKGKHIPDIDLVYGDFGDLPKGPVVSPKVKKPDVKVVKAKHDAAEVAMRINAAVDYMEVRDLMKVTFPDVKFIGWSGAGSLEQVKGTAEAVNDMIDRFPIGIVKVVEFDDLTARFGDSYSNAFAVCAVEQEAMPNFISDSGIIGKRWAGRVVVNTKGPMQDVKWAMTSSVEGGFHPKWNNVKQLTAREATRAIVTHELGHALDDRLLYGLRDNVGRIIAEAHSEHKKAKGKLTFGEFIIKHRPSSYAMDPGKLKNHTGYERSMKANPAEFVAEAIADVVGNGYENAALLSQKVWDFAIEEAKAPKVWLPGGDVLDTDFLGKV